MKSKYVRGNWSLKTKKFGSTFVVFLCIFFFLSGFFGLSLFSKSQDGVFGHRRRSRFLESTNEAKKNNLLPAGESGDNSITSIPFQILSWKPRALYFPNFANSEQCESIIEMARGGLEPSILALREGETEENTKGVRTRLRSTFATLYLIYDLAHGRMGDFGMFISASEDKTGILEAIERKIARATMIPRVHGEAFNILRYEVGQRYMSHYDAFNPAEYGPQKSQRIASFLLYLSDVEEGGETMFPFENGLNMDGNYGYEDCIGLKVRPRQGDGLLFFSLLHNGTTDPTSLHGSCPVIKGEKWVATKWIRDQEQDD